VRGRGREKEDRGERGVLCTVVCVDDLRRAGGDGNGQGMLGWGLYNTRGSGGRKSEGTGVENVRGMLGVVVQAMGVRVGGA